LSRAEGALLAEALGLSRYEFENKPFDGTPGSVTLDLVDMQLRYEKHLLDAERHGIEMSRLLDSSKLLAITGQPLHQRLLRAVAEQILGEGQIGRAAWDALVHATVREGFGRLDTSAGRFQTYMPYLEQCVTYSPSVEEAEKLLDVLIREKDPPGDLHALGASLLEHFGSLRLGERAFRVAGERGQPQAYVSLRS
jgi:tetratricopeptide (TPR) repeat protein